MRAAGSGLAAKQVNTQTDAGNDEHAQTPEKQDGSEPGIRSPDSDHCDEGNKRDSKTHKIRNHLALKLGGLSLYVANLTEYFYNFAGFHGSHALMLPMA